MRRRSISAAAARGASTPARPARWSRPACSIPRAASRYLTIENKASIPVQYRDALAEHAYGCDICQEVCPWNRSHKAATSPDPAWQPRPGLDAAPLLELWQKTDDELRALLKGSAMKRAGIRRLRRNLAVAIGNSEDPAAADVLEQSPEETAARSARRGARAWAVRKLRG